MGHCFCLTRHFTMSVRIDKWLWAARFFKTRSLARNAVQGGKVRLNDTRAKPAKTLEVGDELRIQRGEETWVVHVESLSDRRGPASEAQHHQHSCFCLHCSFKAREAGEGRAGQGRAS